MSDDNDSHYPPCVFSRFGSDVFRSARLAGRAFKASSGGSVAPAVVNYGVSRVQPAAAAAVAQADLENAIAGSTAPIFEPEVDQPIWIRLKLLDI